MTELDKLIPPVVIQNITASEHDYLTNIFSRFGGYPNLEQVWLLMDEAWDELDCDPNIIDARIGEFYRHPVWVLNGLFIEQHALSLKNRHTFTKWVVEQGPKRVADFGGGFGGLARLIGEALPEVQIEVVEPHPHPAAIALAAKTQNVRYVPDLSNKYDILIATDVFEHVLDPISLTAETAEYLKIGGQYLIANCFAPVIQCHLPQLFHFNISWDMVMNALGLVPGSVVSYGRAYQRQGKLDHSAACHVAECGLKLHHWISVLPKGRVRVGRLLMNIICR